MPGATNEPREDFFNDLSRDISGSDKQSPPSPKEAGSTAQNEGGDNYVPRPKRIACILCRKRKLKCDGEKPACGTCSRLGHDCAYDEQRKKSGPKRGYVKLLEQRLKQVENLLGSKGNETTPQSEQTPVDVPQQDFQPDVNTRGPETIMDPFLNPGFDGSSMDMMPDLNMTGAEDFSWELLSLGLDEPLPSQDIIEDMNQIYFEKVHPSLPMIQRARFLASMDLAPHMRPPIFLRYAMWTQACSVTPRYSELQKHFYARARKYAEADEMRGHGESMITLAHAQAWALLAAYEFKNMYFPRAWMSCGRATRLTQMMGLHRCDGFGLDVKQCLPPPRDWTEREERRRTFWMAFCNDRYASIGTGWPMTFDEQDILTNLPASEQAFNTGKPEQTPSLSEVMVGDGASQLSSFAGVILMATLFGRNLIHLHRPTAEDRDHDLNGEFWKRHRALDNILLNTSLSMPSQLRLPAGVFSANIVFLNMNIHTSTICLHQAAIFKADKNRMTAQISAESKRRCIIAADQITNIMKMISHVDLSTMNPFMAFCLYVAARVFVQYLKSRKDDVTVKSSLHFLLSAMQAMKAKNPLTESFLVQLDVDLEGSGLGIVSGASKDSNGRPKYPAEIPVNSDAVHCLPLVEIRESQAPDVHAGRPSQPPLRTTSDMPMDFSSQDFTSAEMDAMSYFGRDPSQQQMPQRTRSGLPDNVNTHFGRNNSLSDPGISPDASGQQPGSGRNSGHPTPSASTTSNKGSSHTSFTPPQFDDGSTSYAAFQTLSPNTAARLFDPYAPSTNKNGLESMNTPFSIPASWDFSADGTTNTGMGMKENNHENFTSGTGLTPGPTGLTPFMTNDGSLQQMGDAASNMSGNTEGTGNAPNWMFTTGWDNNTEGRQR